MSALLSRFAADRNGNFALLSAALALPLVLGVGMALDVAQIERVKARFQAAADSAVVAVAREGVKVTDAQAFDIADRLMASNFQAAYSDLAVRHVGTSFTVTAKTKAALTFGGLWGYSTWPVTGASSADIALVPYEIALVLDTTGSMNEGTKLKAMKDAVTTLVDTMSAGVTVTKNLKFALVPFAKFVNVGPGFGPTFDKTGRQVAGTGADWLDEDGDSAVNQSELASGASRFQLYENVDQTWPGCVETRVPGKGGFDVSDAAPDLNNPDSLFVPTFSIDEPKGSGYSNDYIDSDAKPKKKDAAEKRKKLAKYGVATDNTGKPLKGGLLADLTDLLNPGFPVGLPKVQIKTAGGTKGPGQGCVTAPIVPLGSDYNALKTAVNKLKAEGNTNIMEGVAWGWRVLSPGEPFAQGAAKKSGTRKIMIVLTDGSNTFGTTGTELGSIYTSFGFRADERLVAGAPSESDSVSAMNAKTEAACEGAKKDGIEIYTIRLEERNTATGAMLQRCASGAGNYFDAPSASMLKAKFAEIKDRISAVRITQ